MNFKKIYVILLLSATMNQLNCMIYRFAPHIGKKNLDIYNQQQFGGLLHNQPPNASFWNKEQPLKIQESIHTLKNLTEAVKNKNSIFDLTKEEIAQILSFGLMNPPGMFELNKKLKKEQYDSWSELMLCLTKPLIREFCLTFKYSQKVCNYCATPNIEENSLLDNFFNLPKEYYYKNEEGDCFQRCLCILYSRRLALLNKLYNEGDEEVKKFLESL